MEELQHFMQNNGFIDRILSIKAKHRMAYSDETKEYYRKLQDCHMKDFVPGMSFLYQLHKDDHITYTLSTEAQELYDDLYDAYATYVNNRYDSDSGIYSFYSFDCYKQFPLKTVVCCDTF